MKQTKSHMIFHYKQKLKNLSLHTNWVVYSVEAHFSLQDIKHLNKFNTVKISRFPWHDSGS